MGTLVLALRAVLIHLFFQRKKHTHQSREENKADKNCRRSKAPLLFPSSVGTALGAAARAIAARSLRYFTVLQCAMGPDG